MENNNKLAYLGGEPVRTAMLPYGKQAIDAEDIESVVATLTSDFLTTGPKVEAFETCVSAYVGARYAVAVSNGTAALHLACLAAEIGAGDEVIVSPMSFAATANCVLYVGGTPVFADIDPQTGNIDPEDVARKITSKTKAIIPVAFTGQAADMDRINAIAVKHGLAVIEDGAHALGSVYKDRKVGTLATMTTLSFHPVKTITTGEGGMITTDDPALYEKLLLLRAHGITRAPEKLVRREGPWYYEQQALGYNCRITDIQCALGISQMRKVDAFIERRREIVKRYNAAFKGEETLTTPFEETYSNSGWHLYVIQLHLDAFSVGRREIFEALRAENIGVNVHYIPIYYHPYYEALGYQRGLCPNAEAFYETLITLPLYPQMQDADVDDVVAAVKKVLHHYGR